MGFLISHCLHWQRNHHPPSYLLTATGALPDVTVDIDNTKPVEGWTGRYFITGTATITPESEHAKSYTCNFEVMAEIDGNDAVQIIDTQSKRIHP